MDLGHGGTAQGRALSRARRAREEWKNLCRHLQNLDILCKERERLAVEKLIEQRAAEISKSRQGFKTLPVVDQWVRELSAPQDRRKFLMLQGPSRLGKTAYAFSLVGAGQALEVNCAGVSDPPLRAFSRVKHRLILFDEAGTDMVLRKRRLFQAPQHPSGRGFVAHERFGVRVVSGRHASCSGFEQLGAGAVSLARVAARLARGQHGLRAGGAEAVSGGLIFSLGGVLGLACRDARCWTG